MECLSSTVTAHSQVDWRRNPYRMQEYQHLIGKERLSYVEIKGKLINCLKKLLDRLAEAIFPTVTTPFEVDVGCGGAAIWATFAVFDGPEVDGKGTASTFLGVFDGKFAP